MKSKFSENIRLKKIAQVTFWLLAISLFGYVLFKNFVPMGTAVAYKSGQSKSITELGPKDRVEKIDIDGQTGFKQISDLIYFSTDMPFKFDQATVKITYQNTSSEQQISLGFKDQNTWHYNTQVFEAPFLNNSNWQIIGDGPYLFQKNPEYLSVNDFLQSPPKEAAIGTFNYDLDTLSLSQMQLPGYQSKQKETEINTPLRSKHTFYAYLKNEPFKVTLTKQDLNNYADPDVLRATIYKGQVKVYELYVDDDGVTGATGQISRPQSLEIKNPGPELPENGVYKIVIDASPDIVITSIKSNLHKIVFEGPFYPIENASVFPALVKETKPTVVFTNAQQVIAKTYHQPAFQDLLIASPSAKAADLLTLSQTSAPAQNKKLKNGTPAVKSVTTSVNFLKLETLNTEVSTSSALPITQIIIPKSDVILKGYLGYFAFDPDSLFYPAAYSIFPLTQREDLDKVDFILTDYKPPKDIDGWKVAELKFDLTLAKTKSGKLSWMIKAPGLEDSNGEIIIKDIEIELIKKPLVLPWSKP